MRSQGPTQQGGTALEQWHTRRWAVTGLLAGLAWVFCAGWTYALAESDPAKAGGSQAKPTPSLPAEEMRLSAVAFRKGLKKRGLTELLALYLREFPPADQSAPLLMLRDLKLEVFQDATRPASERRAAIRDANRVLEELIADRPDDLDRFDWMFALAHSLLHKEGEAYITSVLYRRGTQQERTRLITLSTQAVATASTLVEQLAREYDRIDILSIREFERLERRGYIEQLDDLAPKADYLLLWARFYDALPRSDTDPVRAQRLTEVLKTFEQLPAILKTAHEVSHVQVQALLLAGMTCRRLHDHASARAHLDRASSVADRLEEPAERTRIRWAVDLTWIERIRNERDDGQFDAALRAHARFRNLIAIRGGDTFGLALVAAFEERFIHQARAGWAERAGSAAEAKRYRAEAWQALSRFARRAPERRGEIYATVYDLIGADADTATLDPFEQCALIAGLLLDANESSDPADPRLVRIVEVGERFLASVGPSRQASSPVQPVWGPLVPEVLYNVTVARYRQGRSVEAARGFLEVARKHPTFERAARAATFAVELSAAVYAESTAESHPEAARLYLDALTTLVTQYGHADTARYWRFFYAQALREEGRYEEAASQYALVDRKHEHHLESGLLQLRCRADALRQRLEAPAPNPLDIRRRANEFFAAKREFVAYLTSEATRDPSAGRVPALTSLLARARLLGAEVQLLPLIDRPHPALDALDGFEDEYPGEAVLTGRLWRVRLLAYGRLGRLDEAAASIPSYMAADPQEAGKTLQSLYVDLSAEVERVHATDDQGGVRRKAELALLLAEQIHAWATREESTSSPADRYALTVQLAEANLRTDEAARARELFEACLSGSGEPGDSALAEAAQAKAGGLLPGDLRVVVGHAEALFQLGEFAEALPMFNRLATRLPADDPGRFAALLRDLQCRTALKHPPEGIINVIEQQKTMGSDLGGPVLAGKFEALLRENQRRVGGS